MIHIVLTALFRACFANFSAGIAEGSGMFATDGHQPCGGVAGFCTLAIELYTAGHHRHILFIQTHGSAVITFSGALKTRVDTGLKFLVTHG